MGILIKLIFILKDRRTAWRHVLYYDVPDMQEQVSSINFFCVDFIEILVIVRLEEFSEYLISGYRLLLFNCSFITLYLFFLLFQFYEGGVFDTPNCSSINVTHAMTIIGYGTHSRKPYWLLKNRCILKPWSTTKLSCLLPFYHYFSHMSHTCSWGTSWGDKGYIMMARNRSNQCGIASNAIFPTL